jgi:hypothetical protein
MIMEFQLSLEGQAARWYAPQDISTFGTFQELVDKFLELFQVKIDPKEVLKEYYSLWQQAGKSVTDLLLRFRAVQAMLATPPAENIQKRQSLKALREPLRSSFALMDATTLPLTNIVNTALNLDHQQRGLRLSQVRAITPSPKGEEKAFQQAVQCTLCLQFGHSNVECIQRCALCQARTHTTAMCKYNLLARRNAPVSPSGERLRLYVGEDDWYIVTFHFSVTSLRLSDRSGKIPIYVIFFAVRP